MRAYPEYKDSGVEWLGEVPSHWSVRRLKYHAPLVTDKAISRSNAIGLENIESWTGRYLHTETELEGLGVAFKKGDLLFGKLRPYLAKIFLAKEKGGAVGDFHVLRPVKSSDAKFLQYHILTKEFISIVDGSTYGTKMPRASWGFVGYMHCSFPPMNEQKIIAKYLDRETTRIDKLISEKPNFIKLLKEKRQALISHVVTKGLDPHVKMKESGIEWIGEVPEHWRVGRIGYYCKVINGSTPSKERKEYWDSKDVAWLSSGTVNQYQITKATDYISRLALKECSVEVLPIGSLVLGMIGQGKTRGMSAITKIEATINQNLGAIIPRGDLMPEFLHFVLQASYKPLRNFGRGANQAALNCELISNFIIAIPPANEQKRIMTKLKTRLQQLDDLVAEVNASIKLLKEHRTALISAAVTGKIDVRDHAK